MRVCLENAGVFGRSHQDAVRSLKLQPLRAAEQPHAPTAAQRHSSSSCLLGFISDS